MILSLCIYTLLAFILWILAKDNIFGNKNVTPRPEFLTVQNILAILIFGFFYGVRYNVGVDNLMYIDIYEHLENGILLRRDSLEAGYQLIQEIFTGVGLHYSFFIGFWGMLQIGLIYYAMRKNRNILPLVALFIVLGPTWLRWANIMRQAVVECAFVLFIEYIVDKKVWKYIIGVLLCTLIHKSAILLLPFYFILQKPFFPKKASQAVICVLICTVIGMTPAWIKSISFIEGVLQFLEYDAYTNNIDAIMENTDNFRAWGPSRAGLWSLYLITVWLYPTLRKRFKFNKRFDIYYECFFFGTCLYELVVNTEQIFVRPVSYFQSFSVVVVPICLYYCWKSKRILLGGLMTILAFFNTYWWTIKAYLPGGIEDKAPEVYKFFFLQ
jgi:hypothetical protein